MTLNYPQRVCEALTWMWDNYAQWNRNGITDVHAVISSLQKARIYSPKTTYTDITATIRIFIETIEHFKSRKRLK